MRRSLLCLLWMTIWASTAQAQYGVGEAELWQIDRFHSAEEPEYEPEKALHLRFEGDVATGYHDNVYRRTQGKTGDFFARFNPEFRLKSDMKPYLLDVFGEIETAEFAQESENNYFDSRLKARAGYFWNLRDHLYAGAEYRDDHVPIGGFTDAPNELATSPTDYRLAVGYVGTEFALSLLRIESEIGVESWDFDNVDRRNGQRIINDDRDFTERYWRFRTGFPFRGALRSYVQARLNQRRYDQQIDTSLLTPRDSSGYEWLTGLSYGERGAPFSLDAGVGYLSQSYDDAALPTANGPAARVDMHWQPNPHWQLRGRLRREVREATIAFVSAFLQSHAGLRIAYKPHLDWELGADLRFTHNDFIANQAAGGQERSDQVLDGRVSAQYYFAYPYYLGLEYQRLSRHSTQRNSEFDLNLGMLRLGVAY